MTALGAQFTDFHDFDKPLQLPMFMTGKELKDQITESGDILSGQTLGDMWAGKSETSKKPLSSGIPGSGSRESIEREGWNPPEGGVIQANHVLGGPGEANLADFGVEDGHHRIAAAADIEKETGKQTFFPVEHNVYGKRFYESESDVINSLG